MAASLPPPGRASGTDTSGCLFEPIHDQAILSALEGIYAAEYTGADSILSSLPDSPARAYFLGLVGINRFNDLGDTAALASAESLWDRLDRAGDSAASTVRRDPNYPLYRGLAQLQSGYVANLRGGRIRSALLGRKAVKALTPLHRFAEAKAALALYDYYKAEILDGVDWLPFVSKADRERPLRVLADAIPRSRYLKAVLHTSLIWIYYDLERYPQGVKPIDEFLVRHPRNRLYRAMLADFRYRQGDLDSAERLHQALMAEYLEIDKRHPLPGRLPLGYLSSVGNLAKISASRQRKNELERHLAVWNSPEYGGMMKWLPASLRREVDSLKK